MYRSFYFFQAEDGIRDGHVTGVQTCALPILELHLDRQLAERRIFPAIDLLRSGTRKEELLVSQDHLDKTWAIRKTMQEIGRASCRERAEAAEVAEGRKERMREI